MTRFTRPTQQGMTLIELMIAVTLALLVSGVMLGLFSNSKESYILNENLARLQENGRFAMQLMSRDLRWADYRACVTQDLLPNAIVGQNNTELNNSDAVSIVYQPNECDSAASTFTTAYSIQEGDAGRPSLFRSVNGGADQELIEDIANLQLLYGEDTDDDNVPNYYVDATDIADPEQIVSVRLTLTAQTPNVIKAAGDARMTRDFASTIVLRNRIP